MKTKPVYLLILSLALFFSSCSHRLVGTWNVANYETITPGDQGIALSNIGTMTFNSNGTGEKQLDYTVMGIKKRDNAPFEWSATENYVTIRGEDSDINKTWIYMENKGKSQKWKSTDGSNKVQTLELTKE